MRRPDTIPEDAFLLGMGCDERAIRRGLYAAWLSSASDFAHALLVAADWFAERHHPDEAVCRSLWRPVRCRADNPGGWWCWCVTPPVMHWPVNKAGLRGRKVNGGLWLCWPRGWVRFTGGYCFGPDGDPRSAAWVGPEGIHSLPSVGGVTLNTTVHAWCVSIQPHSTRHSVDIENRHGPLGWTALFHPPGAKADPETTRVTAAAWAEFEGDPEGEPW